MFLLILLLPLMNFILISLFGRFIGYLGVMRLVLTNMLISIVSVCYFGAFLYLDGSVYYINLGTWFSVDDLVINFSFVLDKLSVIMAGIVLLVSYVVNLYSCTYMKLDPHFPRFMSYLSLFTFFMIILVTADNFVLLFAGW